MSRSPRGGRRASVTGPTGRRRPGWTTPDRGAGPHPTVLHRAEVSADLRTLHQVGGRRGRRLLPGPVEPRQGRPLHPRRELHRARARGRSTSRTASSPGRPSRPTTPRSGPDRPEYEPRGCPRGAAFSWYTYSPTRVRYPYVRGVLLRDVPRGQGPHCGDPVRGLGATSSSDPRAGQALQVRPRQGRAGPRHLGRGGRDRRRRPRAHDQEVRARTGSPASRPIPAMSMVSHAVRRPVRQPDRRLDAVASTTGTPTCRSPRRRSSATRPTCPSPATGGTPAT